MGRSSTSQNDGGGLYVLLKIFIKQYLYFSFNFLSEVCIGIPKGLDFPLASLFMLRFVDVISQPVIIQY